MEPLGVSGHQVKKYFWTIIQSGGLLHSFWEDSQCWISHPALSGVSILPFDWPVRNVPQEPKMQHVLNWTSSLPT